MTEENTNQSPAERMRDRAAQAAFGELKPGMTRRERRDWYRRHKKMLGLPNWSELQNLKKK